MTSYLTINSPDMSRLIRLTSSALLQAYSKVQSSAYLENSARQVSERVSNLTPSCIFFPLISCQTLLQQQEQQQEHRNVTKFVNFRNEGRQDLLASDGSCICLARHDSAFTCAFNNPFPALCDFPLSSFASVVQLKHHYTARAEIKKHCVKALF